VHLDAVETRRLRVLGRVTVVLDDVGDLIGVQARGST